MKRYAFVFCVILFAISLLAILFFVQPAFSDENYDYLWQQIASTPRESWDTFIAQNQNFLNKNFFTATIKEAYTLASGDVDKAILYCEFVDYTDYVFSDKKEYRWIALYYIGSELVNKKNYTAASRCASIMLSQNTDCAKAYILRGKINMEQNNFKDAQDNYAKAIKIDTNSEDAHYYLAYSYILQGDSVNAKKEFEKVLRINPDNAEARDAVSMLNGQTQIKPSQNKKAQEHFNKAEDLFALKKYKEAIVEYKLAIKYDPKYVKAYVYLGDAYYGLEDFQKAISYYKKAIKLDPNDRQAHRFLGNTLESLYNKTGDIKYLDEAIKSFENAVRVDPNYSSAVRDLKNAKQKREDLEKQQH